MKDKRFIFSNTTESSQIKQLKMRIHATGQLDQNSHFVDICSELDFEFFISISIKKCGDKLIGRKKSCESIS